MVDYCIRRHTPAARVNIQGMDIKRVTSYIPEVSKCLKAL